MRKHVLIMEDNIALAQEWRDEFELNDHQVTLCHNGDDAIAHLERRKFDLVITDMFVSRGKGGLHVITKLLLMRENAPPTIAVTGQRSGMSADKESNLFLRQALKLGASSTIQKPFPVGELMLAAHLLWD